MVGHLILRHLNHNYGGRCWCRRWAVCGDLDTCVREFITHCVLSNATTDGRLTNGHPQGGIGLSEVRRHYLECAMGVANAPNDQDGGWHEAMRR